MACLPKHSSGKEDVKSANVTAVCTLSNILKSSLGPQGLDKMLVDDIGDVTVTNDGATILQLLEVHHPAAKVLVDLAQLQDKEVGDGTTSVVIIAAELLKRGLKLMKDDLHPTSIIAGYRLAMKECVKYIKQNLTSQLDTLGDDILLNIARTSLSSKYIGCEADTFCQLIVDAIQAVRTTNVKGEIKYPVSAVNIITSHGKSSKESYLVDGYALHRLGRAAQGMPMSVENAKIAFLEFPLKQHRMQLGVQFNVTDPAELEKIRQREKDIVTQRIDMIIKSGANVVVSSEGIDDMALKYFVENKIFAVRRVPKPDLHRIAKITGGTVCLTLAGLDGAEVFEAKNLGRCARVYEEPIGDWDAIFFRTGRNPSDYKNSAKAATLVLRGASELMLSEVDRSVHDALCAVSRALEWRTILPGGGAVELALSVYLEDFAKTLGSREQLAIAEFAEALLVIPKTLAINAAQDALELVAKLKAHHALYQSSGVEAENAKNTVAEYKWYGLDLVNGTVRNNLAAGVVEPSVSKIKSLRFATEAAVTILRIDDLIKIEPEPEQQR